MKRTIHASLLTMTGLLAMGIVEGHTAPQSHGHALPSAVQCGEVIIADMKLNADLACDTAPALTVMGPATLDMAGYTVSCIGDSLADGIVVEGDGATVKDGTVMDCVNGLVAAGMGGHRIAQVMAQANGRREERNGAGFRVRSDDNTFTNNMAVNNGRDTDGTGIGDGFRIDGSHNAFDKNTATGNAEDGFDVDGGSGNAFDKNTASYNGGDGFDVDTVADAGGDENWFQHNTAFANDDDGFDIQGDANTMTHNVAYGNGDDGFRIRGNANEVTHNEARDNADDGFVVTRHDNALSHNAATDNGDDGFAITGDGNTIAHNKAKGNGEDGFDLTTSAQDNDLSKNIASGNGDNDVEDDNADCGANMWDQNTFATSSQGCLR